MMPRLPAACTLLLLLCAAVSQLPAQEIVVRSVKPKGESTGAVKTYGLRRGDYERISKLLPNIASIAPVRRAPQTARRSSAEAPIQLVGATPALAKLQPIKVDRGRFLTTDDVKKRNSVAAIDADAARKLFADKDPIGQSIRVGEHYFIVVGVIESMKSDRNLPVAPEVYIPLTTMRVRYGDIAIQRKAGQFEAERYELSEIRIRPSKTESASQMREIVEQVLRRTHEGNDYSVRLSSPRRR